MQSTHFNTGSRITTVHSFGFVALNIRGLRAEDSGMYMCKAINQLGEATSTTTVRISGMTEQTVFFRLYLRVYRMTVSPILTVMSSVTEDLGIPEQERYIQKVEELEAYQRQSYKVAHDVEAEPSSKPCFKTELKNQINIQERKPAHFEARLEPVGDETMTIEWLKNGILIQASQYK